MGLFHTQNLGVGFLRDQKGLQYAATALKQGLSAPELLKSTTEEERTALTEDLELRYKFIPGGRYTPLRLAWGYASIVARKPFPIAKSKEQLAVEAEVKRREKESEAHKAEELRKKLKPTWQELMEKHKDLIKSIGH